MSKKSLKRNVEGLAFFGSLVSLGNSMTRNRKAIEKEAQQQAQQPQYVEIEFVMYEKAVRIIMSTVASMMEVISANEIDVEESLMNDGKTILDFMDYLIESAGLQNGTEA